MSDAHAIRTAAFFDLDGTLLPGTSAEAMLLPRLALSGTLELRAIAGALVRTVSHLGSLEGMLRSNKHYLYGMPVANFELICEAIAAEVVRSVPRIMQREIASERERGALLVLLSGTFEPLARSVAERLGFDHVIATRLRAEDGRLTGTIDGLHPYGSNKALLALECAREQRIDLAGSSAYADRWTDHFVLRIVGNPVVVDPDRKLRDHAVRAGWRMIMTSGSTA